MKYYQKPDTEVCNLNTRDPYMLPMNGDETTSFMGTNEHSWVEDRFDEGLDNSPYTNTAPSLWEE